ncbi:glycosyltransferase [Chlamydiota bacterium]
MTKKFIILAESSWDSGGIGGNSGQQYARTLMRLGWNVSYVEPNGTWKLCKPNKIENPQHTIVMCNFPYTEYNKEIFYELTRTGCHSVCLIVDHWKSINAHRDYKPELEHEFIKRADRVFACNPLNVDRLNSVCPEIRLLRNGVDLECFMKCSSMDTVALQKGKITLGIVASFWISSWIDLAPVLAYAQNHPKDMVHIIGKEHSVVNRNTCPANIIFHGVKHWREIPEYIQQFDVCVVPYNSITTRYTNPIKVLEYLASGKPVVSCYNKSISDYPYVYFYRTGKEFEQKIKKAFLQKIDHDVLFAFLKKNTWEERITTITSCFALSIN